MMEMFQKNSKMQYSCKLPKEKISLTTLINFLKIVKIPKVKMSLQSLQLTLYCVTIQFQRNWMRIE